MIRDASPADLPLLREILRRANDAPYDIDPVAEEKCFGRGLDGEPRVRLFEESAVAVTCGRFLRILAVDRGHRRRGIGSALLKDAGATIIAAEAGNYFTPGVLEKDAPFFLRRGYVQTAECWNLHVTVKRGDAPVILSPEEGEGSQNARSSHSEILRFAQDDGAILRAPGSDPALLEFVRRHFGRIWAFEVERAAVAFWIPEVGFAAVEANNRGLGTFGPTGVAKAQRGRGHGRALLSAALGELGRLGYRQAIIPWTDAVEFYRRSCGAEPAHHFLTLTSC